MILFKTPVHLFISKTFQPLLSVQLTCMCVGIALYQQLYFCKIKDCSLTDIVILLYFIVDIT